MCCQPTGARWASSASGIISPPQRRSLSARSRYTVFQSAIAAVTRASPLARYCCASTARSRNRPRRWKQTARARALRASPLLSSTVACRRSPEKYVALGDHDLAGFRSDPRASVARRRDPRYPRRPQQTPAVGRLGGLSWAPNRGIWRLWSQPTTWSNLAARGLAFVAAP